MLEKLNSVQKKFMLLLAGAQANLAFAPYDFFAVLLISFPVFLLVLQSAKHCRQAFWFGWWFGFGHFLAGLYWIPNSLLVEGAEHFAWLIPFAAMGIPAVLAVYIGLVGLAFYAVTHRFTLGQIARIFVFINLWLVAEFLRAWLFTGFPWNLLGYSLLFNLEIAQVASLGGVFLASLIALFFAFLPLYFRNKKAFLGAVLLALCAYGYGAWRIESGEMQAVAKSVKLIQPNHKQTLIYDPALRRQEFEESLALMAEGEDADYYIWAEATGVYTLSREPQAVSAIAAALPEGALAIVGADRSVGTTQEDYEGWNSMYVISKNGIEAVYDKHHLVPFGEYVPLSTVLPLQKITAGMIDFSRGKGEKRFDIEGLNAIPLICYEIIFGEYLGYSGSRPDFVINITNDAWFGDSSGPHQHLAMSRMRAIESGLPVLRTAKTGISAVVNSYGQIEAKLGLKQAGIVLSDIPDKFLSKTIYARFGLALIIILLLSSSIIVIFSHKKKIKHLQ